VIIAALALAVQPAATLRVSDAEACTRLRTVASSMTADAPQQVDEITRLDGVLVTCGTRSVSFNKTISVPMSALVANWQEDNQRVWNGIICGNPGFLFLTHQGWRFVENRVFRSGERIAVVAHCQ
jgi:hypothetical protein